MALAAQVFARGLGHDPLADMAVILLNRAETPATVSVGWSELGLPPGKHMAVRDVINSGQLPPAVDQFAATVAAHDVVFVRLTASIQ